MDGPPTTKTNKTKLPPGFKPTLLICTNRRPRADVPSCAARGAKDIAKALIEGLKARNIDLPYEEVCCLGQCQFGPAVRVTGQEFYLETKLEDVPRILDELAAQFGK